MKPKKNYIIVATIFTVTILVCLYLADWYKKDEEYRLSIPVTEGVISSITLEELDHYLTENNSAVLFICENERNDCREVGETLNKIVQSNLYATTFNYMDINYNNNFTAFKEEFNDKYTTNSKLEDYPALIIIEEGIVVDIKNNINQDEIDAYLDLELTN